MDTNFERRIDRRTFLLAMSAAATAVAADTSRLDTFSQWASASRKTRERALQPCVERIRAMDDSIQAWVQVLPQRPTGSGKLSEIPFGVKDIIETRGLATEYGSPIYKGRIGTADAAIVRELRRRGGVLLGKTQSTAFAYRTPAPTRNPRDLAHTPGGSSSGSAAAVAASMVALALGTQTGGSVLRPASFCGVYGFKPTHGLIPRHGMFMISRTLDHVGLFARTIEDVALLASLLVGYDERAPETRPRARIPFAEVAAEEPPLPPMFAFVKTARWDRVAGDAQEAFAELTDRLGDRVEEI